MVNIPVLAICVLGILIIVALIIIWWCRCNDPRQQHHGPRHRPSPFDPPSRPLIVIRPQSVPPAYDDDQRPPSYGPNSTANRTSDEIEPIQRPEPAHLASSTSRAADAVDVAREVHSTSNVIDELSPVEEAGRPRLVSSAADHRNFVIIYGRMFNGRKEVPFGSSTDMAIQDGSAHVDHGRHDA